MPMKIRFLIFGLFVSLATGLLADSPNWPSYRGENSRGVAEHPGLPDKWSATENVEWKVDVKGRGWSSPIVWGDKVFLTTATCQKRMVRRDGRRDMEKSVS